MDIKIQGKYWINEVHNNEYNLNNKEAFKLMLDGKEVIDEEGYIYSLFFSNISFLKYENNIIMHRGKTDANTFLKSNKTNKVFKFKEYTESKPRKFEFEAFIGENPNNKMIFDNSCTDQAFGYYTSHIQKNKLSLSDNYEIISKFKVTMEEILE